MLKATIVQSVQPLFWDLLKQSREVVITSAYVDLHMVQTLLKEIGSASHEQLKSFDVILGLDEETSSEALRLLLVYSEMPGSA